MSICLAAARAAASRSNGAKSRGPKTPAGKARAAQNALKHGFRAQKYTVLPSENAAEFQALEASMIEELAPEGALQSALAQRVVAATWRLSRAERLEAELFAENHLAGRSLGLALIRDCNGARSFDTLLRYRGGTLAELWRALRTLKALQAEAASRPHATRQEPAVMLPGPRADTGIASESPIEPEGPGNPGEMTPTAPPVEPEAGQRDTDAAVRGAEHGGTGAVAYPRAPAPGKKPIEPEARGNPGGIALLPAVHEPVDGVPARRDVDAPERLSRARGRP